MSHTISATFKNSTQAREALMDLERAGYSQENISVVSTDNAFKNAISIDENNKAAEGGTVGAAAGGLLGAVVAGLAATGAVAIPGVNLLVFGSAIAAAAGLGVGATVGGLTGALIGLGIPEYEAKIHENEVKQGSVLLVVTVETSEEASRVKEIFKRAESNKIAA